MQKLLPVLIFFISTVVHAAPVTWSLNEVTFADGGTLAGSFVFDADTAEFSDINIQSNGGGALNQYYSYYETRLYISGSGYSGGSGNSSELNMYSDVSGCQCSFLMNLGFAASLTNAGGSVAVLTDGEYDSYEDVYSYIDPNAGAIRNVVSGSVSAVPVPAAVWLFGSALAGLGWMRRKQTA